MVTWLAGVGFQYQVRGRRSEDRMVMVTVMAIFQSNQKPSHSSFFHSLCPLPQPTNSWVFTGNFIE